MSRTPKTVLARVVGRATGSAPAVGSTAGAPTLEAERDELIAKRDRVEKRLASAETNVAATEATRKHLWASEVADEAAIERARRTWSEARGERDGLAAHLAELNEKLADVESRIVERDRKAEAERVATDIEARAERVREAVRNVDAAARLYAEARAEARIALWPIVPSDLIGGNPTDSILTAADKLARGAPISEPDAIMHLPQTASDAAGPIVSAMRTEAAAIRAGERPPALPYTAAPPAPALPPIPDVRIVLSRPIRYPGLVSEVSTIVGAQDLPKPVAEAAMAAGIGFDPGSPDGMAVTKAASRVSVATVLKKRPDGVWAADPGEPVEEGKKPEAPETWLRLDVDLLAYARGLAA